MKTKLVIISLLSVMSITAFSQRVKVGFKGGASVYKLSGKSFKEEFSFGYHAGAFAEIKVFSKFYIQPEILFSQTKVDTSKTFSSVYQFKKTGNIQLNYMVFPVLLNYKPINILTLQVGPQFGILINKNNTLLQNGKQAFTTGDFSILGGIQLNINHFKIYGRYVAGLSNINDIDNKEQWRGQSIQLGIGFTL